MKIESSSAVKWPALSDDMVALVWLIRSIFADGAYVYVVCVSALQEDDCF
jgi:hypothetical protein